MQKNNTFAFLLSLLLMSICQSSAAIKIPTFAKQTSTIGEGEITISVPSAITILQINNQKVQAPSLAEGSYNLNLPKGDHSIVAQYYENWDTIDEAGNIIRWYPVVLNHSFTKIADYQLDYAKPSDSDDAEKMTSKPSIWLSLQGSKISQGQVLEPTKEYQTPTKLIASKESSVVDSERHKALEQKIEGLQKELEQLKTKQTKNEISFDDWAVLKQQNSKEYQRFKEQQEYEAFLEYKRKQRN